MRNRLHVSDDVGRHGSLRPIEQLQLQHQSIESRVLKREEAYAPVHHTMYSRTKLASGAVTSPCFSG
jgi:hypothetical protein